MILRINSVEDLRNPVLRCKAAINKGDGSNSLYGCMLFEATTDGLTGRLSITVVDTRSHQMTLVLPEGLVDVQEPGVVLVPYDYISDLLIRLPNSETIELEVDSSNRMQAHCGSDQFEIFLHQGSVEDFRLAVTPESSLPDEVCVVPGIALTRLIGEATTIINEQEDFKLVGIGDRLHAFTHDRGSNIVSHSAIDTQDQESDWSVGMVSRLIKLIYKYWLEDVSIHLRMGDDAAIAFKCNKDFFIIRQLSTEVDVSIIQAALAKKMVGHFIVDGTSLKSKAKLLDLAKSAVQVEVRNNLLKFTSAYTQRGNNDVRLETLSVEGQQPKENFNRDFIKKAISAMEASQVQIEWVPLDSDLDSDPNSENSTDVTTTIATNHLLRFTDADAPSVRSIMITPVQ